MTNKFENMSAEEIAEEIISIDSGSRQVNAAFKDLKVLDASVRKNAVDALEKDAIDETKHGVELWSELGVSPEEAAEMNESLQEGLKGLEDPFKGMSAEEKKSATDLEKEFSKLFDTQDHEKEDAAYTSATQALCQIFNHIAKIKGDAAHPVTKAIVQELSTLPKAGHKDPYKLTSALINGYEKGVKQGPKKPTL